MNLTTEVDETCLEKSYSTFHVWLVYFVKVALGLKMTTLTNHKESLLLAVVVA